MRRVYTDVGAIPEYESGEVWTLLAKPPGPGWEGFAMHFPLSGPPLYGWRKGAVQNQAENVAEFA